MNKREKKKSVTRKEKESEEKTQRENKNTPHHVQSGNNVSGPHRVAKVGGFWDSSLTSRYVGRRWQQFVTNVNFIIEETAKIAMVFQFSVQIHCSPTVQFGHDGRLVLNVSSTHVAFMFCLSGSVDLYHSRVDLN